jgi:hypothetical protein
VIVRPNVPEDGHIRAKHIVNVKTYGVYLYHELCRLKHNMTPKYNISAIPEFIWSGWGKLRNKSVRTAVSEAIFEPGTKLMRRRIVIKLTVI